MTALLASTVALGQQTSSTSATVQPVDDDVVHMNVFEVSDARDHGYLRMNTATATRIGMEIQKVPLAIAVVSSDFIEDTGMRDMTDLMRYQPSASGDTRMGIQAPGNSATPSGTITMRGFPISQRLRNGVFRYTGYSFDNIERVEITRGPASVFYGVGYPGGVINYVTKKAQFAKLPTVISYGYGGTGDNNGDQRVTFDQNTILLQDKAAMRILASWTNEGGAKNYEYDKGFTISPSVVIKPFANDKLVLTLEYEHTEFRRNQDITSWVYDEQFFRDYWNPSSAILQAAGINPTDPNALYKWRSTAGIGNNPVVQGADIASYANTYTTGSWIKYKRIELGDPNWVPFHTASRGAYYTSIDGKRVHDEEFNYFGSGSYTEQKVNVLEATLDFAPVDWFSARFVFTNDDSSYEALTNSATPMANGYEWNVANPSKRGDERAIMNYQLDLVFQKKLFGVDHKFMAGGLFNQAHQKYYGYGPYLYNNIPGAAEYDPSKPDNGSSNIPPWLNNYSWGLAWQTLKDRYGDKLNAYEVFARYDPGFHDARPDVSRITAPDRSIVDQGKPRKWEGYLNYMADLLEKRLHLMGGYRWTFNYTNGGNMAASNPPWYGSTNYAYERIDPSMWNAWGIGGQRGYTPFTRNSTTGAYTMTSLPANTTQLESYYQSGFGDTRGDSWMLGGGFDITKEITVYASYSKTSRPQGNTGGVYNLSTLENRARLLGLDPATEIKRLRDAGLDTLIGNEEGTNIEAGVKTTLFNNKLVGTLAIFQLERENEALESDYLNRQEVLNYTLPNKGGEFVTGSRSSDTYGEHTGVRRYVGGSLRRSEGAELEVIWSPIRNFQLVGSASWIWTAKTINDASILDNLPQATKDTLSYYAYEFRMPGVSEYRFNAFGKYTFTTTALNRMSVSFGARYASKFNIANNSDYDSKRGGLTGGDYVVCDFNISYPWEIGGFKFTTALVVTNLFDENYVEGGAALGISSGYNFSPPRVWMLTNTLKF